MSCWLRPFKLLTPPPLAARSLACGVLILYKPRTNSEYLGIRVQSDSLQQEHFKWQSSGMLVFHTWLVVLATLKNMSSSMGRIIPYILENKTCLKPPTRYAHTFSQPSPSPDLHLHRCRLRELRCHRLGPGAARHGRLNPRGQLAAVGQQTQGDAVHVLRTGWMIWIYYDLLWKNICIHIHIYIYTYIYIVIYIYICIHIYIYVYTYIHTIYIYIHYIYIYVCVCACMHIYTHIYIYMI